MLSNFELIEYGPAPESGGPAMDWIGKHGGEFGHFIGGRFVKRKDGARFESRNPATGELLAAVAQGSSEDVDQAVACAKEAQPGWQEAGGAFRARCLYALARSAQKNSRLLAVLETLDNGKPIREARDIDVPLVARHFHFHAGAAKLLESEFPGWEAHGVCGQIIPWNFPLLMLAWKVAPALATGNAVVLKPAEYTSLSALLFAELAAEAGLPPGVLNVVTGDGRTGAMLAAHDGVDKIAFTGSTSVGRSIREATAGSGKALTLELGGKSPFIVFEDADLDSAVEGLVDAIWFNQGQVCCAGSRLLVQEGIAEKFHAKTMRRMGTLRMGDPLDKSIDVGAIVDPVQLKAIDDMVESGREKGSRIFQPAIDVPSTGCFYPPTLITGATPSSPLMQEEIFGPVLVGTTFRTPGEAVELANNTRYGLAASIWTENINLALGIAPQLACGVVWVNSTNLFDAAAGFGGRRESGFGREGGWEGLHPYLKRRRRTVSQAPAAPCGRGRAEADSAVSKGIDRTAKQYIGGRQARPDGGYSLAVRDAQGRIAGHVGRGNRKDIRNAVEAARSADGWARSTGHLRSQILYFIAENLSARASEFSKRIAELTSAPAADCDAEVAASIDRLFTYGAWADKFDGAVHGVPLRGSVLAMNEPLGVIGAFCPDERPLIGAISLMAPIIATGNTCVLVPSESKPSSATDLYQVLDTSDVPPGVVNIVTGLRADLVGPLAGHYDVDGIWYFGEVDLIRELESASAGNLKPTWAESEPRDWMDENEGEGREFLRNATQVKNVWIPYGE